MKWHWYSPYQPFIRDVPTLYDAAYPPVPKSTLLFFDAMTEPYTDENDDKPTSDASESVYAND